MKGPRYDSLFQDAKDYVFIVIGITLYAFGFCAFILPHQVVMGGLTGVGTLVFYASNQHIPVAVTSMCLPVASSIRFWMSSTRPWALRGKSFTLSSVALLEPSRP